MIKIKRRLNPGLVFFSDVYEKMAEGTRSLDPFAALYLTANFVKVNNQKPFFGGSEMTSNYTRDINICRKPSTPTTQPECTTEKSHRSYCGLG